MLLLGSEILTFTLHNLVCTAVSRQQLGKDVPAATHTHAIIEVLLEEVFLLGPYKGVIRRTEARKVQLSLRVEAGSNTSTVALRVLGDDEKKPGGETRLP
jgi:hypothetical protein